MSISLTKSHKAVNYLKRYRDRERRKMDDIESEWHKVFKIYHRTDLKEHIFFDYVYIRYRAIRVANDNSAIYSMSVIEMSTTPVEIISKHEYFFRKMTEDI